MNSKKYQIFLSSTFLDLQRERSAAVTSIMRLGHIPVGMELFPATDKKQWDVIEKAVNEADYYVLMVGGRYGSTIDGISYTEAEYNLAKEIGVPVIPLLRSHHESIFHERGDESAEHLEKLTAFRSKLGSSHTCQYWETEPELAALLFQGLLSAFDAQPREGWVRGSTAASEDILSEINSLRKERDGLKALAADLQQKAEPRIENIADLTDYMEVRYEYSYWYGSDKRTKLSSVKLSWADIFKAIGPRLMNATQPPAMRSALKEYVEENKLVAEAPSFFASDMNTVKIHLIALGLISSQNAKAFNSGVAEFVILTDFGKARLAELLAQRKASSAS